ncbi:bifunctional diaminohydroxyphosphoribosylaminopyrimidine deaminase/5-amino-6-(5-phosphoribosylamino)uracil reductase RibD [Echinimonas agarilytica]|uniref:Riboflavin biosynthesis protein RibD n=1 Tax=Echinimonas agarilytica TaxID=1215918 RepID=A0AA41W817_9GAMM|nr:bifunctional diaminohydroxyphosphoribosylaminopyrimidine deaminase/5-amino-6-(5-phosphoribosylamino)uracil reductase RibD [Echinimonas agarilytica]MCM2680536.1 bifunctional diaminohydroxyphosphoribosylaminopyrimidine deaminase/5-amino-6-(5-phosphoribosylamino)uracil reductase RibD [Echinimonas agarilytica]
MAASEIDHHWMTRAIQLARKGWYTTTPNPRVGCVIVGPQGVLSEGAHLKAGLGHAEANAIADAKQSLEGATAYVTLEPCSHTGKTGPCSDALIAAKVKRVVVGMTDPNPLVAGQGIQRLENAGIEVEVGVLAEQCEELNPGFLKRMKTDFPRVTVKMASSLDGKTALANGKSKWITSSQARSDVQRFRAESCAVLSSAETVLSDNARLTVRQEQLPATMKQYGKSSLRQPDRIILDGRCRLTGEEPLFEQLDSLVIVRPEGQPAPRPDVRLLSLPYTRHRFDLPRLVAELGARQYNELWVEAGPALSGAFVAAGLVDRLVVYIAPKLMGHHSKDLLALPMMNEMNQVIQMQWESVTNIGPDVRLIAEFK